MFNWYIVLHGPEAFLGLCRIKQSFNRNNMSLKSSNYLIGIFNHFQLYLADASSE